MLTKENSTSCRTTGPRMAAAVTGIIALLCSACTAIVQPHVSSAEFLVAGDKLPATVELYVTEEFRSHIVEKNDISEFKEWQFQLGPAAVDAFRFALEARFRQVDVKLGTPQFPRNAAPGFFAVVTPSFSGFSGSDPVVFRFENYTAEVEFEVSVYDAGGALLLSRRYAGKGTKQGSIGNEDPGHAAYPVAVQNAIKDAVGRFAGDLVNLARSGYEHVSLPDN